MWSSTSHSRKFISGRLPPIPILETPHSIALIYSRYRHCQQCVPIGLLIKSLCPPFKGGNYEGLKVYKLAYGRDEQRGGEGVPPFSKRGARGDF